VLPWIIAVPAYSGTALQNVINWSSLIVGGFVNFVIPFIMFIIILRPVDYFNDNSVNNSISHYYETEMDNINNKDKDSITENNFNDNSVYNSISHYYETEMDNINNKDKDSITERFDRDLTNSEILHNSLYENSNLNGSRIEEIKVRNYEEFPSTLPLDLKIEKEFHAFPKWKWLSPLVVISCICIFITLSIVGVIIYDIEHAVQSAVMHNSFKNSTIIISTILNSTIKIGLI